MGVFQNTKTVKGIEDKHSIMIPALENPTLVPPFLDTATFNIDFADTNNLWPLH
jgi:hypothetical protein